MGLPTECAQKAHFSPRQREFVTSRNSHCDTDSGHVELGRTAYCWRILLREGFPSRSRRAQGRTMEHCVPGGSLEDHGTGASLHGWALLTSPDWEIVRYGEHFARKPNPHLGKNHDFSQSPVPRGDHDPPTNTALERFPDHLLPFPKPTHRTSVECWNPPP